jgi:hypothetical protein
MTALVTPIHTGTVNGHPVRFFKGPSDLPQIAWHAVEDFCQALGMVPAVSQRLLGKNQETWGRALRTVATADGLVTIAPHFVVCGLFEVAFDLMTTGAKSPAEIICDYFREASEAVERLASDLPPLAHASYAFIAFQNTIGFGSEE